MFWTLEIPFKTGFTVIIINQQWTPTIASFRDVAPCRSCVNQRFGGTYHLHLQGRKIHKRETSIRTSFAVKRLIGLTLRMLTVLGIETNMTHQVRTLDCHSHLTGLWAHQVSVNQCDVGLYPYLCARNTPILPLPAPLYPEPALAVSREASGSFVFPPSQK
jgi:hypothetical protein